MRWDRIGKRPGWRASIRARCVFGVFVLMGALSGWRRCCRACDFAEVDPKQRGWDGTEVIAAVVVGGTAISGGRGTMLGSSAGRGAAGNHRAGDGVLTRQAQWEKAIQGIIILAAVARMD